MPDILHQQPVSLVLDAAVHVLAGVGRQQLGGADPQRLLQSLDQTARLTVADDAGLKGDAESGVATEHRVGVDLGLVAAAGVGVEDRRDAAALFVGAGADAVTQGVGDGFGGFGQARGPADHQAGGGVDDGADLRTEGLAVPRVSDPGLEAVTVALHDFKRDQVAGVALAV